MEDTAVFPDHVSCGLMLETQFKTLVVTGLDGGHFTVYTELQLDQAILQVNTLQDETC